MTETNLALNEEKRTVIFEDDHVFNRIYSQLDDMDFFSTKTSALVNGGCGLSMWARQLPTLTNTI